MISSEEVGLVRDATDFVALVAETVVLRQRSSGDFWGCCPFHHEKSPSFHVDSSKGLWYCFGCGTGGDVFDYVCRRENLEFPDAVRYLAERASIELHEQGADQRGPKRNRLVQCVEAARDFYHSQLMRVRAPGNDAARAYLAARGFGSKVAKDWSLGYAPGRGQLVAHLRAQGFTEREMVAANVALRGQSGLRDRFYERVMFPVTDERGHVVALGGRTITGADAKYINTSETPIFHKGRQLFAYDRAKESIVAAGEVLVVEGYADAISLHEAGITNVVAVLGTALTPDHLKLLARLRPKRIVMMLDGDAPGQAAAEKVVRYVDRTDAALLCVTLPDGADPDEFVRSHGGEALRAQVAAAEPLMEFVLTRHLEAADLGSPGGRVAALDSMAAVLAPLADSPVIEGYATRLADVLGMEVAVVLARIRSAASEREPQEGVPVQGTPWEPDPWDPGPWEAEPEATVPGGGPDDLSLLSADERSQYRHERELLCLMCSHPGTWAPFEGRIRAIRWVDATHGLIAGALLGLDATASPGDAVAAAVAVAPEAKAILAAGMIDDGRTGELGGAQGFLLDNIELFSVRRRLRTIRAELAGSQDDQRTRALLEEVVELQARERTLTSGLTGE